MIFSYIDAEDSPPSSCSVVVSRDCGDKGCVVSAIANYTERISAANFAAEDKKQALEFLIHFLGGKYIMEQSFPNSDDSRERTRFPLSKMLFYRS